jgi:uncharacterized RDD family membrane protein YckC
VAFVLTIPLKLVMGYSAVSTSDPMAALPMILGVAGLQLAISITLQAAYQIYFLSTRGATIGKLALGLKVIRADGGPLSVGLATGRFFAYLLDAWFTLTIGFIIAGFDSEKRALHDRICDTRVIYSK